MTVQSEEELSSPQSKIKKSTPGDVQESHAMIAVGTSDALSASIMGLVSDLRQGIQSFNEEDNLPQELEKEIIGFEKELRNNYDKSKPGQQRSKLAAELTGVIASAIVGYFLLTLVIVPLVATTLPFLGATAGLLTTGLTLLILLSLILTGRGKVVRFLDLRNATNLQSIANLTGINDKINSRIRELRDDRDRWIQHKEKIADRLAKTMVQLADQLRLTKVAESVSGTGGGSRPDNIYLKAEFGKKLGSKWGEDAASPKTRVYDDEDADSS